MSSSFNDLGNDAIDDIIEQGAAFIDNIYRELNESRSAVENLRNRQSVNLQTSSLTSTPHASSELRRIEDADHELEQINNYCDTISGNLDLLLSVQSGTSNSSDVVVVETPMPTTRTIPNRGGSPEIIDLSALESSVVVPRRLPFSTNEVIDLCTPPTQNDVGFSSRVRRSRLLRRPLNTSIEGVGTIASAGSTMAANSTAVSNNTAAAHNMAANNTTTARSTAASRVHTAIQSISRSIRPLDRLTETAQPTAPKVPRKTPPKHVTLKDNTSSSDDGYYKCPICLENVRGREPTATKCGHVFCNSCIKIAVQQTHKCPLCNTKLNRNQVSRIYL